MRSNIATAAFLLLCVLVFGFGMNACGGDASRDRFDFAKRDFNAKICGTVSGDEVETVLQSRPSATDGEYDVSLSYNSPDSLAGLTVSRKTTGIYEARLGELVMHDFKADGLLEPFLTLLYQGPAHSVARNKDGIITIKVNTEKYDLEYLFPQGYKYPQSIKGTVDGRKIELFVQGIDFVS